jgi:hypothetical protein
MSARRNSSLSVLGMPIYCKMLGLHISSGLTVLESISNIKDNLNLPFSMEIIVLAAWSIWILRNEKIFNNIQPSFRTWKAIYFQELIWLGHRIKKKHEEKFKAWLQDLT